MTRVHSYRTQHPARCRRLVALAVLPLAAGWSTAHAAPTTTVPYLKVDQFGYLGNMGKVAIVVDPQAGYNAAESFTPGTGANQYQVRRWADDVPDGAGREVVEVRQGCGQGDESECHAQGTVGTASV